MDTLGLRGCPLPLGHAYLRKERKSTIRLLMLTREGPPGSYGEDRRRHHLRRQLVIELSGCLAAIRRSKAQVAKQMAASSRNGHDAVQPSMLEGIRRCQDYLLESDVT
jgi:hypothetical protein